VTLRGRAGLAELSPAVSVTEARTLKVEPAPELGEHSSTV
jgi:hypothetical protein